jgi:hypothetical protein
VVRNVPARGAGREENAGRGAVQPPGQHVVDESGAAGRDGGRVTSNAPVPFIKDRAQLEALVGTDERARPLIDEWESVSELISAEARTDAQRFLLERWIVVVSKLIVLAARVIDQPNEKGGRDAPPDGSSAA